MKKSNLINATRYSYLISQQVDLETQQIDTFSACIDAEAEKDPRQTCIKIMTEPGYFELFNNQNKADTCTTAVAAWNDVKSSDTSGLDGGQPEACAVLTSHVFQAYSWYLQDLSDGIIGALTEKLTETIAKSSNEAEKQKEKAEVVTMLKQQTNAKAVEDGIKMVNDIGNA